MANQAAKGGSKPGPIDPAASPRWALGGRIVTVDSKSTVVLDGVVWIADAAIAAITQRGDAAPAGFEEVTPLNTGGTVLPGLIDLHNHTPYDVLPLWNVPQPYTNRDTWGNSDQYHQLVTAPMKTIGEATELLPALVRYVECKALVGGVTTTQGIALFSAPGIRRYYRGIVRNVEQTGDKQLPEAGSRVADVAANDPQAFLAEIEKRKCFLLHLSEGTDDAAHKHFLALQLPGEKWAITAALAGIHCVALKPADFGVMASHDASMVWSPFSNLLLYGHTADIASAVAAGSAGAPFKVGLGSDWSPTGSKSLFGELKIARVYSQNNRNVFSNEQIVRMATIQGAQILTWDREVGSLEVGKRADLVVVSGQDDASPVEPLFAGDERTIQLVAINGTPRYGTPALMVSDGPGLETLTVGGEPRVLYLTQTTGDTDVAALSFADAKAKLADALKNLQAIRLEQEAAQPRRAGIEPLAAAPDVQAGHPRLALDEFEHTDFTQRPHLPLDGVVTGPRDRAAASAPEQPLSAMVSSIELDALTVADDPGWLDSLETEHNLPDYMLPGLRALYGDTSPH
ncbi:MAG TPA: amidohydrolase family protein [Solirubrobacteraceae bacterium]|nr:amidohydrolase family protein [Solirubrobacteraceae bacterium]